MSDVTQMARPGFRDQDVEPGMLDEQRPFGVHVVMSVAVLVAGALANTSDEMSETGSPMSFPILCALVLLYALLQIVLMRRYQPRRWVISPAAQTAIFLHLMPTASVLILSILPVTLQETVGFVSGPSRGATRYEWLNLIGSVALWTGYWSGLANGLAKVLTTSRLMGRVLRPDLVLNTTAVFTIVVIACTFRLLTISLGLYGYSSSYDALIAAGSYTEYLAIASDLGRVALVAVSLAYFRSREGRWMVISLLVVETAFGVLSGFKSAVVIPTIIVGITHYAVHGHLPRILFPVVAVGIFAAYAVIEPFRTARNEEVNFDGTSLFSIVGTFSASRDVAYQRSTPDGALTTTAVRFLARSSDVGAAAPGIEYAARTDELPHDSPAFLKDIFLSPFYSFIPRFIWDSKPTNTVGLWYTRLVANTGNMSSTAMYPVTYLNFAGGALAVFLGFFAVGTIQSVLFRGLLAHGGAAIFVMICMIGFLGHVDSVFYSFFVSVMRYFPLLVAVQWVLFRPAVNERALQGSGAIESI